MLDYKSLCPAVTTCNTLVNRHTNAVITVYNVSAQLRLKHYVQRTYLNRKQYLICQMNKKKKIEF